MKTVKDKTVKLPFSLSYQDFLGVQNTILGSFSKQDSNANENATKQYA